MDEPTLVARAETMAMAPVVDNPERF